MIICINNLFIELFVDVLLWSRWWVSHLFVVFFALFTCFYQTLIIIEIFWHHHRCGNLFVFVWCLVAIIFHRGLYTNYCLLWCLKPTLRIILWQQIYVDIGLSWDGKSLAHIVTLPCIVIIILSIPKNHTFPWIILLLMIKWVSLIFVN